MLILVFPAALHRLRAVKKLSGFGSEVGARALRRPALLAKRYVMRLTKLAFLPPVVVDAFVEGLMADQVSLKSLMDGRVETPIGWGKASRCLR
jgi:hypothetical protein